MSTNEAVSFERWEPDGWQVLSGEWWSDGGETRLYAGGTSRVAHDFGDYVAMGQIGLEVTSGQAWFDDAAATSTTEVTKETWYYYAESRRVGDFEAKPPDMKGEAAHE